MSTTPATPLPARPKRAEYFTYATGLLNDSQSELIGFIIPLYALMLGLSPLELGVLVSAKAFLPSLLAIHGGVLMDRFGTRLVMLLMGAACTVMPPLFPVLPWFPALLLLQMAVGMVMSFGWIGAQALAVEVGRDNPKVVGRFSFFARIGVMGAPVLAGLLWDFFPAWVSFAVTGALGAAFWLAVRAIPPAGIGEGRTKDTGAGTDEATRPPFRLSDLLPRPADYLGAIGLLAIPAVAFVVIVSSVRIASALMQQSFYILHLGELGLQATVIGLFVTLSQLAAAGGTLTAAWFSRRIPAHWVFLLAVVCSVFFIYSTPIYGGLLALLAAAIAIRGFAQGVSQPIMYTLLSQAVKREHQATAIALRSTGNRVAGLIVPVVMGAIAEIWGIEATFYVTGAGLLAILIGVGVWLKAAQPGRRAKAPALTPPP